MLYRIECFSTYKDDKADKVYLHEFCNRAYATRMLDKCFTAI